MRRRTFLAATGAGITGAFAGCSAFGSQGDEDDDSASSGSAPFEHPGTLDTTFATNGEYPSDGKPADGVPPTFSNPPDEPDVGESSFETIDVNGESVRLAPIDIVEVWYRRGGARFVDARGIDQYRRSHIYGSVLSTAQQGSTGGGIDGWPTDGRVVTYCGCPHHLSSLRAAGLQKDGFSRVYAIDEGFGEWADRNYPMAGTAFAAETQSALSEWTIEGRVDIRYADEYAWASVDRQYEATPIQADGRFTLVLKFADVTSETPVRVSTPAFTVTRPLGDLAAGTLHG